MIAISGQDTGLIQKSKWNRIKQGDYQIIITTGQYFGEGTDIKDISCLFLVYPFAFKGKLIQYIGRVQRSPLKPVIYDYRDKQVPYLNKLFLKRNAYYRNLDREATLFDDLEEDVATNETYRSINKTLRIAISDLDFQYGMVCFSYTHTPNTIALQFEIENEEMQPEFEVLKPYFSKILGSKFITAHIQVEFESQEIISQLATSQDVDRINKEVIDSVKFQFIDHNFIKSKITYHQELEEELTKNTSTFFDSEEQLLAQLLGNNKYVHAKQLYYLAKYHNNEKMKIRYVLQPFSFVFLLAGEQNYHVVLETLNTKEATYVWHLSKDSREFQRGLDQMNQQLMTIKNKGRQYYLENSTKSFSRIIHDYSDNEKRFYKWKNALEERLV